MRFIIREQEYEKLIAAGRLTYRAAGKATGALERWRLTQAIDGFWVMRVDLDRRETTAASSTLFHLLLDPHRRPERLKVRHFSGAADDDVDVLIEDGILSVRRTYDGQSAEEEMSLPAGFGLLMPAIIGLALFVDGNQDQRSVEAIALDEGRNFMPTLRSYELTPLPEEELTVTGQRIAVRPYLIRGSGMDVKLWLDDHGLPVRLDDSDDSRAIEDRYVRHR